MHPDGYLEHFESNLVTTSIYYEAMCVELISRVLRPVFLTAVGGPQARHVTNGPRLLYLSSEWLCNATRKVHSPPEQNFGRVTSRYSSTDTTAKVWNNFLPHSLQFPLTP